MRHALLDFNSHTTLVWETYLVKTDLQPLPVIRRESKKEKIRIVLLTKLALKWLIQREHPKNIPFSQKRTIEKNRIKL